MTNISKEIVALLNEVAESENFYDFRIECVKDGRKLGGFLSDIQSVRIVGMNRINNCDIIKKELNLLCKTAFPLASQRDQFNCDLMFDREALFYQKVAPEFIKFQRDRGLSEEDTFSAFPRCYKAVSDDKKGLFAIILEDLRPKGFALRPQNDNCPEKRRLILRELAKFHAISFAMRDQCPERFESFEQLHDTWPVYINTGAFHQIYTQTLRRVAKMLDGTEYKSIYEAFLRDLEKYTLSWSDESVPNKFRAVSHGDLHDLNILFRGHMVGR